MVMKSQTYTPKQRVLTAIARNRPDRVPSGENQVDGKLSEQILGRKTLYNMGWRELNAIWNGNRDAVVRDYCTAHVGLLDALAMDYIRVPAVPPKGDYKMPRMTGEYSWVNKQGEEVYFNPDAGNLILKKKYPEMTADQLPDPDKKFEVDPSELEAVRYVVEKRGKTHFIIGRSPIDGTFPWEHTVGMENFLVKMVNGPGFVEKAVDVYVTRSIAYIEALLDAGVDAVMTVDDYCDNRGPIMGPGLFRKYVLPGIRRQVEAAHRRAGLFIKHTDGNVWPILDDLIEAGIDGWHGIQRNIGMDLWLLKKRYGKELCFFGGVNTETIIGGAPDDVRKEVQSAILETEGEGVVLTCSNVLAPGTKMENLLAMRDAIIEYGEI